MSLPTRDESRVVASAALHSLLWLVVANAIGVMIATLLLAPGLNRLLGEWTYGRWVTVHMNLELYGWTALPLTGFLFKVYGADCGIVEKWCRPVLWVWSTALGVGALAWLSGYSSGKLFLDWSGYARVLFPLALMALWVLLATAFATGWNATKNAGWSVRAAKLIGLLILLAVPFALFVASSPGVYPAVNPDTGGPTGVSQLESSLTIVAILLMLPFGIMRRNLLRPRILTIGWAILIAQSLFCIALGRADITHHRQVQYLSLALLLVWIPIVPVYYAAFEWHNNTRRWRMAFLCWWGALVVTGWIFFLPPVIERFKFTDGLVGHSFTAMAGFTSSILIFVMVQLMGEHGWIFNRSRSFYLWHAGVIAYIVVVTIAGWFEGGDPAFTIVPGAARDILYTLRLLSGIFMLLASLEWFADVFKVLRKPAPVSIPIAQEVTL